VVLVADEIHADFVFAPARFVPMLEEKYDGIISLCAASKTFNLAGLQQACLITRNKAFKTKVEQVLTATGVRCGNIFALEGTRAAYEKGDAWLDGLMKYLDEGRAVLKAELEKELPKAKLVPIEATYLAFIDLKAYGYTTEELMKRTLKNKVMFTEGTFFSSIFGEGFLRFNFACPHRYIIEGVKRLKNALI
jgi:Bifunctional PLP-dependent enzyme with beta-cystathionase and maltose regulon repressor activities